MVSKTKNKLMCVVCISFFIVLTIVFLSFSALAKTDLTSIVNVSGLAVSGDGGNWTGSDSSVTWTAEATSGTDCLGQPEYKAVSGTLTFTNNAGTSQPLTFSYSVSDGATLTIEGVSKTGEGNYKGTLDNGKSLQIGVKTPAGDGDNTATIIFSNISLGTNQVSVTFLSTENGSYTHHF